MPISKKHVLIAYLSVGSGHKNAALGLKSAIESNYPDYEVTALDLAAFLDIESSIKFISKLPGFPFPFIGSLHHWMWKNEDMAAIYKKILESRGKAYKKLQKLFSEYNPDVVFSTHFFAGNVLSSFIMDQKLRINTYGVITDFRADPYWPFDKTDGFLVPSIVAKNDLVKFGTPENKIFVTGIPLRPAFQREFSIKATQPKKESTNVLVLAGGEHSIYFNRYNDITSYIIESLCNKNCNVTVIYGHNENLFTNLKKLKEKYPNINTIDYTPDMDKLLEDSDFIVTKPGGLICYESIVTRTPMLLFNLNHGEARGDMEYMVDNGCAIVLNNEGIVDFTIKNILDRNKEVIRDMSLNMVKLDFTKQMQNFILNDSALKFSYSGAFVSK